MSLLITGSGLTIKDVVDVARYLTKVKLHPDAIVKELKEGRCAVLL